VFHLSDLPFVHRPHTLTSCSFSRRNHSSSQLTVRFLYITVVLQYGERKPTETTPACAIRTSVSARSCIDVRQRQKVPWSDAVDGTENCTPREQLMGNRHAASITQPGEISAQGGVGRSAESGPSHEKTIRLVLVGRSVGRSVGTPTCSILPVGVCAVAAAAQRGDWPNRSSTPCRGRSQSDLPTRLQNKSE